MYTCTYVLNRTCQLDDHGVAVQVRTVFEAGPELTTPRMCGNASLSRKDIEHANTEVMRTLEPDHSQQRASLSVLVCSCYTCLEVRQLSCRFHSAICSASIVRPAS